MTSEYRHTPVLLAECLEQLTLQTQHTFVDATLGGAGHSFEVAQRIGCGGTLIGIDQDDVALAVSHSGSSKDIVEALKIAKQKGATTVAITNCGKSPIQKQCDHVLFTSSDETKYNILALNSRSAQLSIVNAIYFYIVYRQSGKALESIKETERSLLSKKY